MKPIRSLFLVLFLAAAISIGAEGGTASATVVCSIEMPACPPGSTFGSGTEFSAKLAAETSALFETSSGTIACHQATVKGKTSEEEGEPLLGELTSSTFSECKLSETSCTVETGDLPFKASFTYAKGEEEIGDGTIELSSSGKGEPIVNVTCGSLLKCTYGGTFSLFDDGGEPGEIRAEKVADKLVKGFLCPKEATFTATYVTTLPENGAFLVQDVATGTKLCKQEPTPTGVGGALKCNAGQGFSGGIEFTLPAMSEAIILYGASEIRCNKVKLTGNFQENGEASATNGGIQTFTMNSEVGGVLGDCTSTLGGTPRVGVTMQGVAYNKSAIAYLQPTPSEAAMGLHGTNGAVKIQVAIGGGGPTCVYKKSRSTASINNGSGAGVKSKISLGFAWIIEPNQPNNCSRTMGESFDLKFERTGNGDLYVARE